MGKRRFQKNEDFLQGGERVNYRTLLRLYKVFGRYYKKHWKLLAVAYTGLLLTIVVALFTPWPLKLILDHVILEKPLPARVDFLNQWFGTNAEMLLAVLVVAFVALRFLDSIVSYMHKVGILSVGEMITTDARELIFSHLQRLSLSFHESARSGDLIYRLTSDIRDLKTVLIMVPENFIYRVLMIVTHVSLMMVLEWRLALLAFSVIPVLYYFQRRLGSGIQTATRKKRSKESDVTSIISENVTAMALVQAYGREDLQQTRFESENRQSLESGIEAMRLSKMFKRTNDILAALGTSGVVYFGGSLALDGMLSIGTLVLFASYMKNLYGPIEKFASMFLEIAKAQVAGDRILELVECDMVIADSPHAVPAPPFKGHIEFRRVAFGYQHGVEVLKNISFTVEPGETIALVGHSGAGKSTLVSLLLRFYDPHNGQILFDGRDIRDFTLKSLRAQVTILLQEARLFNQTVRENIAFGKIGATEEEIIRAAKLAQAHDFIMEMPEGYDTEIYEGGDNLSGGQKQRINIARAIIRNTPILILDEPATALDARAEAKIHQALDELTRGKTTFMIAHRFSTLARADKILVLEQGRLAGFGTHEELMQNCREYRELYELQIGAPPALGDETGGRTIEVPVAMSQESL
ncbi:MAG: ABC transporter ATP-binding protein/permease [candidate division KSB1 bacterium]|nr:ABC transporter ATP-binding protein/permease [candidate division KSB1 bacterium]